MFVSSILDPDAIAPETSTDYLVQVKLLLQGLVENGVVFDAPDRSLRKSITRMLEGLPQKRGNTILSLWTDLLKSAAGKRIINTGGFAYGWRTGDSATRLADNLAKAACLDALLTNNSNHRLAVPIAEFDESAFERMRRRLRAGIAAIDVIPSSEVDEFFSRAMRYSKWLRIYDGFIGTGNNLAGFRRGVGYLLSLYCRDGMFVSREKCEVQVITCEHNGIVPPTLKTDLLQSLKIEFPSLRITIRVKAYRGPLTHDRYLESQQGAIQIGRGFDFRRSNGSFQPTSVSHAQGALEHLARFRALPDRLTVT